MSVNTANDPMRYRTERFHTTEGYAVGFVGSGGWLTVLGSAHSTIPLFATAEAAEAWHAERFPGLVCVGDQPEVRKVERRGGSYFKIV